MSTWNFSTPDELVVEARVPAGHIDLYAEDTAESVVEVTGKHDEDELVVELQPASGGRDRLVIDLEQRGRKGVLGWLSDREFRVRLTVPQGSDVDAFTGSADLSCHGMVGALAFKTGSGDLLFQGTGGDVNAKTASGDIIGRSVGGDLRFAGASGDVQVGEVTGVVNGKTASGDVQVATAGGSVQLMGASGDVDLGSVSSGDVTIRSVSGDIKIGVARGTQVWLDLGSTSGDAVSELDPSDGGGEGETVELHVNTVSGDIRVRSAGAA